MADIASSASIAFAPEVRLHKNVMIPMRDGVRLAADLYVPDGAGAERWPSPWPVVVDYIPYRKDELRPQLAGTYTALARAGYAMARIDIRGTGASEGANVDEYTLEEQLDGVDAIEWLAAQPWCDGHVNMTGISYGGFTSLQVAAHRPAHLTSIIPIDFTDDRYTDDCHYRGGLLRMYYDISWYGTRMIAWGAMPPDPDHVAGDWAAVWDEHLARNEPYLLEWLRHQSDGPYWRNGSVGDDPSRIVCPTFLIGGWRDGYPNPPLRLYAALSCPKKVLVGPWNHALPDAAIPGPRIDYMREVIRWLDHWNRGIDTGIMAEPPVVLYIQHWQPPIVDRIDTVGEWRAETAWPPLGARELSLWLDSSGRLTTSSPGEDADAELAYVPTVGIAGGLWSGGLQFGLPGDQRPDEAFSLVYSTDPLSESLVIIGMARALLHVQSTASVIGFAANLSDVSPDGSSHLVAKAMLNASRRSSLTEPSPLPAGEVVELVVSIDATAWTFPAGHRIRLSIANADFPNVWPTPELAQSLVHTGPAHPSRLVLPTVPLTGSAEPPSFAASPVAISPQAAAPRPPAWEVTQDLLTGRTRVRIETDTSFRVDANTVIERAWYCSSEVDPADPAHASAHGWHACRSIRPNQIIESRADTVIQSTATDFHVTIDLAVRVNGAVHFTRRWAESIPRLLL